ncbi:hypothetical protein TrCOL_g3953, partial [Triparma columacea]
MGDARILHDCDIMKKFPGSTWGCGHNGETSFEDQIRDQPETCLRIIVSAPSLDPGDLERDGIRLPSCNEMNQGLDRSKHVYACKRCQRNRSVAAAEYSQVESKTGKGERKKDTVRNDSLTKKDQVLLSDSHGGSDDDDDPEPLSSKNYTIDNALYNPLVRGTNGMGG